MARQSAVSIETVRATPGFSLAAASLRRGLKPDYSKATTGLIDLEQALRVARILQELDPDKLFMRDGVNWMRDDDARQSLLEDAVQAVEQVAPLMEETVEIDMMDGFVRLVPAEMGYAMNWDDWYETVNEPGDFLSETDAAWAFCEALAQGDENAFGSFSEYFGWGLRYPKRGGGAVDFARMYKSLARRGLGCFKAAWKIAMYDTGNLYFDYNVYEDNLPLPSFSIDGVRELERQYQEAQPILAEYRECVRLFAEPEVPAAVLRIYVRSLVKEPKQPATLAEAFRAEQERERARVRIGPDAAPVETALDENDLTGTIERINAELRQTGQELTRMYHELGLEDPDEGGTDD